MRTSAAPVMEHRQDPRVGASVQARFSAPGGLWAQEGTAVIEEASACGLRLRSKEPLHADESLILRVPSDALELHARVLWVKEVRPHRFGSRREWIAGCRLAGDSVAKARFSPPAELRSRWFFNLWRKTFRIIAAIGVVALLVYVYFVFATLIGGRVLR